MTSLRGMEDSWLDMSNPSKLTNTRAIRQDSWAFLKTHEQSLKSHEQNSSWKMLMRISKSSWALMRTHEDSWVPHEDSWVPHEVLMRKKFLATFFCKGWRPGPSFGDGRPWGLDELSGSLPGEVQPTNAAASSWRSWPMIFFFWETQTQTWQVGQLTTVTLTLVFCFGCLWSQSPLSCLWASFPCRTRLFRTRGEQGLWDAAATWPVVIFVAVAPKQRSPKLSVSWLALYWLVDRLPVSTGNFKRALQRHFLVDFRNQDVAGKIFFCSKRACLFLWIERETD